VIDKSASLLAVETVSVPPKKTVVSFQLERGRQVREKYAGPLSFWSAAVHDGEDAPIALLCVANLHFPVTRK
jgi:hypothetical protein